MIDHENDVLAVASQTTGTVGFFELGTGTELRRVDVGPEPHEVCFDPRRRRLYVAHTYESGWYLVNGGRATRISVVDVDRREVVGTFDIAPEHGPHDLHLGPDPDVLYVSVEDREDATGAVLALDLNTGEVTGRIGVDAHGPHWFALTPDGKKAYTANKEAPFVSVVDVPGGTLAGKIPMPGSEGIAIAADGAHVFVAAPAHLPGAPEGAPGVRVIDVATDTVVRTIPTEHPLSAVHVTSDGKLLVSEARIRYNQGEIDVDDGDLLVYSATTFELLGKAGVGKLPLTVRSTPDGALAFVSNTGSGRAAVVDLATFEVLMNLDSGPGSHGLAYVPAR